jgi:uncharacterized protein with FMN-binding domain
MRRTTLALAATTAGLAALVGLKTGSAGAPRSALAAVPGQREPAGPASGSAPTGSASSSASSSPSSSPSSAPPAPANGSFTGSAIASQYGTVQVRAVVRSGRLTDVVVLRQTDVGERSTQIDSYAIPVLKSEALSAQSADIDVVSGATYTSVGYARSLQAALDAARR